MMRNAFWMERYKIARYVAGHARILLTLSVSTRDALIVRPQPLLIFERHRAPVALMQIADRILLHCILLQLTGPQTQAAQRIVQFPFGGFPIRIIALCRVFPLLPALEKPL